MAISKPITHALSAGCLLGVAVWTSASLADTTTIGLINPLLTPQQQAWELGGNYAPINVKANGIFVTANTIGAVLSFQLWYRNARKPRL